MHRRTHPVFNPHFFALLVIIALVGVAAPPTQAAPRAGLRDLAPTQALIPGRDDLARRPAITSVQSNIFTVYPYQSARQIGTDFTRLENFTKEFMPCLGLPDLKVSANGVCKPQTSKEKTKQEQSEDVQKVLLQHPAVQQADAILNAHLNSGLSPFLGPKPGPSAWAPALANSAASDSSRAFATGIDALLERLTRPPTYLPPLLANIFQATSSPALLTAPPVASSIPSTPPPQISPPPAIIPTPGPCLVVSVAPTTITFINLSSNYAVVELIDSQCNPVPFNVVFPGNFYVQSTFAGFPWRVRDAFSGQIAWQGFATSVPSTVFIYNPMNGLRTQAQAVQTGSTGRFAELAVRYRALGQQQLLLTGTDPALSTLRAELNKTTLKYLATDPLYVYLDVERSIRYETIYRKLPSYHRMLDLEAEIGSWTATGDAVTLQARYDQRQQLALLKAQLDQEEQAYRDANPGLAEELDAIEAQLEQRRADLLQLPAAMEWYRDWQQRYLDAEDAVLAQLSGQAEQIFASSPLFKEFVQLNNEVGDLLPQFDTHPTVRGATQLEQELRGDASALESINEQYEAYIQQSGAILGRTRFKELSEQYQQKIAELLNADPTYQQLQGSKPALADFEALQRQIYAAALPCFESKGQHCNPAKEPAVQALISDELRAVIDAVGGYHEQVNVFWYRFYNSTAYLAIENSFGLQIEAAEASVQADLEAARRAYNRSLDTIPQVKRLHDAQGKAARQIRGDRSDERDGVAVARAAYPYEQLDQRLRHIEQLSVQLEGGLITYLPFLNR